MLAISVKETLKHWIGIERFVFGLQNTQVIIREPIPGRDNTWTGPGFMRVFEGDTLTFRVDDIPKSLEYDIFIRYEPQVSRI